MNGQKYFKNVVTLELDVSKCNGCEMCTIVCPHRVFKIKNKHAEIIDKDLCMECGACEKNCAFKAITVRPGVGCVAGIIRGTLNGTDADCCCGTKNNGVIVK
ncbi:4Fe-4S binding protein [Candidatus Poribacteria bacterium]|nr:4Fe-4S binding protein [Candidatus Poribacteria bacterium]